MSLLSNIKKYLWDSLIGNIIVLLLFINFAFQAFVIPSSSMEKTLMTGDFLFVNKHKFGLNLPIIPILEIKLLPDKDKDMHLTKFSEPERGEIVVFRPPFDEKTYFVKRLIAKEGDKLFFYNKKLFINFKEEPTFISEISNRMKFIIVNDLKFYINPYLENYPGIQYAYVSGQDRKSQGFDTDFETKLDKVLNSFPQGTDMVKKTMFFDNSNISYIEVPKDKYFVMGDNRNNSNDSRFWGYIEWKHVVGTPSFIWMSIDFKEWNIRIERIFSTDFNKSNSDISKEGGE